MPNSETTALDDALTESAPVGQEVQVAETLPQGGFPTDSYSARDSVPNGLPETLEGEQEGYVFRIGSDSAASVTITINTERLIERAKVRRLNRAFRRARQR